MPLATVGLEKWRREYNESIVGDLDKLMADIEERVANMDRQKEEMVEAAEKGELREKLETDTKRQVSLEQERKFKPL